MVEKEYFEISPPIVVSVLCRCVPLAEPFELGCHGCRSSKSLLGAFPLTIYRTEADSARTQVGAKSERSLPLKQRFKSFMFVRHRPCFCYACLTHTNP